MADTNPTDPKALFMNPAQTQYGPPVGYGSYPTPPNQGGQHQPPPPESYRPLPGGTAIIGQPQGNYGPMGTTNGNYGQPPPNLPAVPGGANNWMGRPQNVPNCPPGLEYLTLIDTLIVNQIFNLAEALANEREPENQFAITNNIGQNIYFAKEESDDCSRQFCGSRRAFRMKIFDNYGNQVIHLSRPIACQACCFPCCLQKIEISSPPGTPVGLIEQEWSLLHPTFRIKGTTSETILQIKGPMCTMNCYADVDFKILTADGLNEVGKISKKWSGYASENAAKTDVFGISFPIDLDVRMKAVMLGACFLIDMMYFEQNVNRPNANRTGAQQPNVQQQQPIKPI